MESFKHVFTYGQDMCFMSKQIKKLLNSFKFLGYVQDYKLYKIIYFKKSTCGCRDSTYLEILKTKGLMMCLLLFGCYRNPRSPYSHHPCYRFRGSQIRLLVVDPNYSSPVINFSPYVSFAPEVLE
ncbi:hypothetical protein HanOQP8_Chr15g0564471 [Helianthus annuus]|nr:hypothetical protein HanHA89_Chr15g0605491 [Helianthus annuus]KAJ0647898.1 hypothetical protein HanLR1_Chr15g0566821 [Helianthus annuus]KAJ0651756.1 hypothetical protein HanOQP8_Chr15g0564471 [Helianthus annuus]